jgi:hypothetical protein
MSGIIIILTNYPYYFDISWSMELSHTLFHCTNHTLASISLSVKGVNGFVFFIGTLVEEETNSQRRD